MGQQLQVEFLKESFKNIKVDIQNIRESLNSNEINNQATKDNLNLITNELSSYSIKLQKLDNLSKVVLEGNGKPGLKTQVSFLEKDIESLKKEIEEKVSIIDSDNKDREIEERISKIEIYLEKKDEKKSSFITALILTFLSVFVTYLGAEIIKDLTNSNNNNSKIEQVIDRTNV